MVKIKSDRIGVHKRIVSEKQQVKLDIRSEKQNIDDSTNFMICSHCRGLLEDSYSLKNLMSENEDLIRSRKSRLNLTDSVTLEQLFNDENSTGQNICRICLNSSETGNLRLNDVTPENPLCAVLQTCLWEVDAELTDDPIVCAECQGKLRNMYAFRAACLTIEDKILQYCKSDPETKNLDINKILNILKGDPEDSIEETDFLSEFEVRDEEEADIFDNIAVEPTHPTETAEMVMMPTGSLNMMRKAPKRPIEGPAEVPPSKKVKRTAFVLSDGTVVPGDLPHFKFCYNMILNPTAGITLEEWLREVDTQKKKDELDVYNWFGSMADIMTWDEWRAKVLKAFPSHDDYWASMRLALSRKKRPQETFTEYYAAKVELLNQVDVTGEKAVSCLLGGLTNFDSLIGCIGRIGDHKTPEDLLAYFKKCDEKQAVVSKEEGKLAATPTKALTEKTFLPHTFPPTKIRSKKALKKEKCYNCGRPGHLAIQCKFENTASLRHVGSPAMAPVGQLGPKSTAVASTSHQPGYPDQAAVARKPKECFKCRQVGHERKDCPMWINQPGKVQPQAHFQAHDKGQPSHVARCAHCGQTSHTSFNCPNSRKVPRDTVTPQQMCQVCHNFTHTTEECYSKKNPNKKQPAQCVICHKWDHAAAICPQRKAKNEKLRAKVYKMSMAFQRKESSPAARQVWQNDVYQAQRGQSPSPPTQARRISEYNSPLPRSPAQQICLKCYKIGHDVTNCPKFAQMRAYRN
ncbi:hypothetical protein NQ318_011806 [Aromia moschata]|uniref:CCHC-type domain-containing protein n=1 Tax=Aromia moschata TaxID=1265417 RepID=A0AAV8Y4U3_9CUCU|nr:hypothetical protein NQ318_011806 [Aromia moschata]